MRLSSHGAFFFLRKTIQEPKSLPCRIAVESTYVVSEPAHACHPFQPLVPKAMFRCINPEVPAWGRPSTKSGMRETSHSDSHIDFPSMGKPFSKKSNSNRKSVVDLGPSGEIEVKVIQQSEHSPPKTRLDTRYLTCVWNVGSETEDEQGDVPTPLAHIFGDGRCDPLERSLLATKMSFVWRRIIPHFRDPNNLEDTKRLGDRSLNRCQPLPLPFTGGPTRLIGVECGAPWPHLGKSNAVVTNALPLWVTDTNAYNAAGFCKPYKDVEETTRPPVLEPKRCSMDFSHHKQLDHS